MKKIFSIKPFSFNLLLFLLTIIFSQNPTQEIPKDHIQHICNHHQCIQEV